MNRQKLIERVNEYSQRFHLLEQGDRVITGISGGPDSVCLFFILLELQREIGFEVEAVHVNHGLRGADANADETFVRQLCRSWAVPCHVFKEDVNRLASEERMSLEEAGREARRRCFELVCEQRGGTKIALAHHMDDNAETLIMNLCRGSGLRGLGGMRPKNGQIIRPLLCLRRREVEQFLQQADQTWREDESNKQDHYTRNRIRNHVLPYLTEEVNTSSVEHINAAMEQMRELEDYLADLTERAYHRYVCEQGGAKNVGSQNADGSDAGRELLLRNEARTEVPKVIRTRLILKCMSRISGRERDISAVHVEQVDDLFKNHSGKRLSLPHWIQAFREYDGIRFVCVNGGFRQGDPAETEADGAENAVLSLSIPGETMWREGQFTFRCKVLENTKSISEKYCGKKSAGCPYTEWFNYDIIKERTISVRSRQAGDYMVIDRQGHRKKLKTLLIDARVPVNRRSQIPVLAVGGEVLWVPGVRRSSACLITEESKQVLQIECTEDKQMAEKVSMLISEEDVDKRISELGKQISEDYAGKQVHLICILKGGVFFLCELAKRITVPVSLDFMKVGSYGDGTSSSGIVKIDKDLDESLEGKDVIIVEDIIDSGRTLYYLLDVLEKRNPKSMRLCTLLDKPERREKDVKVDYVGFAIPDEFVVGYGLDYAQKYRNLPYIGVVEGVE